MHGDSVNSQDSSNLPVTTFQSDDLLEKLKMLNYEKQLLNEYKMKPLSRFYFVKSFNPGEQFFMFTLICWWLCRKLGKEMDRPQEFDDPNTVIAKIVQILDEMDVPVDFPPNKLIRGAGPICLNVLDILATQATKVAQITYNRPHIAQEDEVATDYLEDNAEIILEKLEDEQNAALSDDSDMEVNGGGAFKNLNWINRTRRADRNHNIDLPDDDAAAERFTDQQQWRQEFERVLPQLKVYVKADARDWRTHFSQIETLKASIDECSEDTQSQLKKLHSEFTFSLEKIESREKHLNNELQSSIRQFKEISIELSNVQHAQMQVQTDTEALMTQLNSVIQENDIKKNEMERRGQSMSDGSSVVNIKKAINKLKEDTAHLNLEVALLVHGIDQDIMRQAGNFTETDSGYDSSTVKTF
ncbi:intraflagellar transport protein 57 homolog [Zeugodacus cucurbitae]|uniref:intraflagellar transport protein 57 homolog n=1 Tax=Zeugodacus cucurbitae TaxID=28588 RepID=UPI0023D91C8A|nr:intraflagellar transport protein 57 homolog [Zeugodacus cucurbitae]XP_054083834.1 intraflagellar transport protein 57 homolog [Zeugodacus cucurbitae]